MLEMKDLCFTAKGETGAVDILNHVNLTVDENKFVVITGPNGGGKTTLAKAVMGIVQPTAGQILWNGTDIHYRAGQAWYLLWVPAAAPVQGTEGAGSAEDLRRPVAVPEGVL